MDIRTLTVEFLRAGTRHNQLLSPLTPYLVVFGNSPASVVTLPYEHREMELRLQDLSYKVEPEDRTRRQEMLDRTGQEIAAILAKVEGVSTGLASETERSDTLTQLRVVFSASELAMLPFELSKVLAGGSVWLALQARAPVCITRHIRSVSAEGMRWPTQPRILFVAGPETPVVAHRDALVETLAPWTDSGPGLADWLVCLEGEHATLASIEQQMLEAARQKKPFTHVHILAHGTPFDANDRYSPVGVTLWGAIVPGKQLAMALTSMAESGTTRPVVVTLATCDSDVQRDVRTPDASVAHDLHDQGIPLIVASQFPLSIDGSTPFIKRFYRGQLEGEHPVVSMYEVRRQLYKDPQVHDWASLVVYEALPSDFDEQREDLRYWQARRAQDHALDRVEALTTKGADTTQYEALKSHATELGARLPTTGPYVLECAGLRAAGHKRIAQVAFQLAVAADTSEEARQTLFDECLRQLEKSHGEYRRATREFLAESSEPRRRKANLHWLLGQVLSLDVVLGGALDLPSWNAARFAAQVDMDRGDGSVRAWAYVSLGELALLRLADENLPLADQTLYADEAMRYTALAVELLGRSSEHAKTTCRQFERYVTWWGNRDLGWAFEQLGLPARQHWHRENGLVATAARVVNLLRAPHLPSRRSTVSPSA
jgi:hypothetical protein